MTVSVGGGDAADELDSAAALHLAEALHPMIEGLEHTLLGICRIASSTVGAALGSAVSLIADGRPRASASDDPRVRAVELLQYSVGDGPALSAIRTGEPVLSASLAEDPHWTRIGRRAHRLGVNSVMAVPLTVSGQPIGALSCYATAKSAFDSSALRQLQEFAEPAAEIAFGADTLIERQQRVDQLTEALQVRPVIDQAVGIIRARTGESESDVLRWLRRRSNVEHVKVSNLARQIVDEAARRANRRSAHPNSGDG